MLMWKKITISYEHVLKYNLYILIQFSNLFFTFFTIINIYSCLIFNDLSMLKYAYKIKDVWVVGVVVLLHLTCKKLSTLFCANLLTIYIVDCFT